MKLHAAVRLTLSNRRTLSGLLGLLVVSAACASGDPETTADREAPSAPLQVTDAWSRPADSGATGGVYLTIRNGDSVGVELVGITTAVAGSAEVHETMDHDGMVHMMARPAVTIPARDSLTLKPGGLHVMLTGLTRALSPGDSVPLSLMFSDGRLLPTTATVRVP